MIYKLYACTFPGKSWKYHHTQQQKKNKRNYMCINTSVVRSKSSVYTPIIVWLVVT